MLRDPLLLAPDARFLLAPLDDFRAVLLAAEPWEPLLRPELRDELLDDRDCDDDDRPLLADDERAPPPDDERPRLAAEPDELRGFETATTTSSYSSPTSSKNTNSREQVRFVYRYPTPKQ